MKQTYHIGDDLFLVLAFSGFMVAVVAKLLGISLLFWGVTSIQLFGGSIVCLLFSIALSLREVAKSKS
ncbi:MAG: hypothetical protein ABIC18_00080 [Candidatus Omnitrophota bacterium]